MNISLESRIINLTDWFSKRNRRPLLGFYLDSQYPLHRYPGSRKNISDGVISPGNVVVEDYYDDCDRLYEMYESAGGDLIWSAAPFFGIPWMEAALGCVIKADHTTGSVRSGPPEAFGGPADIPLFDSKNAWVTKAEEFHYKLNEHSGGRYPVGATLMRGISDLLSALYGGEGLLYRIADDPAEVGEAAKRLAEFWISFATHISGKTKLFRGGTGAFFYSVWCPGKTVWMQEDTSALLSPPIFDEYIYPYDLEIINEFENTVIHFHPSGFMPAGKFVKSGIGAIEIHIDKGGPPAEKLYDVYMEVLTEKPLIIWGDLSPNDLEFIKNNLPTEGLLINTTAGTPEEAVMIWERFFG